MRQETGETRDAIIEADNQRINEIVERNKGKTEKYWIVVFAKPSKASVDGKPTLVKHIKEYFTKPRSQVGMITGEVDNKTGQIKWEVNMPQRPFDFDALTGLGAKPCAEVVTETTTIPGAYVTK